MSVESPLPPQLEDYASTLEGFERGERIEALISIAERFRGVPESVAIRPYADERRVPGCESQAFVYASERPDGRLDFHFAVENPQGISARALAVILAESLSAAPLEEVVAVPTGVVDRIFGSELSLGKSLGLTGMLQFAQREARKRGAAVTG